MDKIHGGYIGIKDDSILDFSSNVNPLGIPESVRKALVEAAEVANVYPDVNCTELKASISKLENVSAQSLICGNGATDIIYRVVYAVKPVNAAVLSPCFYEYEQALKSFGTNVVHTLDTLENADIIFICNPNNPTGSVMELTEIEKILEKCSESNVFVCIDECFGDFLEDSEAYSAKQLIKKYNNLLVIKAFTKMYGMAGVRLGYGITSDIDILKWMEMVGPTWNVSQAAQLAGIAACEEREFSEFTRKMIKEERSFLYQEFKRLGIEYYETSVNFILFKSIYGLDKLLKQSNIYIRNCENFWGLGKGYYRIAIRKHEENEKLIEALERILA